MPTLVVIEGPDAGKVFALAAGTGVLGRDRASAFCLNDSEASRKHAEIRVDSGAARLIDLGSANGTRVNGQAVKEAELWPGDRVGVGATLLEYREAAGGQVDAFDTRIVKRMPADRGRILLEGPGDTPPAWMKANLAAMYESSRAISQIVDLDELMNHLMDLIFRCIRADHACLMLKGEDGTYSAKAVRSRDPKRPADEAVFSRTIMDAVLADNQGVLLADAGSDERFQGVESVSKHSLREVICAPMAGRHDTLGVLFLDTRSNVLNADEGRFTEEHLALAIALAHQAALAIEDTRYRKALLNSERLAAIGHTIAAISHHVKNIMQGMVFGSDMVRGALEDGDQPMLRKGWQLVEKNQRKIHDLVLDMLSYSKPREPELDSTDLNVIAGEVVELLQGKAADLGVDLVFDPVRTLPRIQADPDGLHKALLNIVGNALDAVEETPHPRVEIRLVVSDAALEMQVIDNGPGIPDDRLAEIFKPFISTKGTRGTGLGLPISQKIMQEHGGDLLVESLEGAGCTFRLVLPRSTSQLA